MVSADSSEDREKKRLWIEGESVEALYFGWDVFDKVDTPRYVLQGITPVLACETLVVTDTTSAILERKKCESYLGFRVVYGMGDSEAGFVSLGMTANTVPYRKDKYSEIKIKFLESYGGKVAISMQHDGLYNYYCIYDCKAEGRELILTTEDIVCVTDVLVKGHKYLVEGYGLEGEKFVLKGYSDECVFDGYDERDRDDAESLLSVVVTVYNSEDYLPRCLDSIIASTMHGIKIILVEDKSEDESSKICEWYCRKYQFIERHAIKYEAEKKPNVSDGRNTGVECVTTPWMAFMDSDDTIHPYAYEKLYDAAVEHDAEISICQVAIREEFGKYETVLKPFKENEPVVTCSLEDMMLNSGRTQKYFCGVWNKIVKTEIARKVRFPGRKYFLDDYIGYEDIAYTPALYSYVKKLVIVKDVYYVWEKRHRMLTGKIPERWQNITKEMFRQAFIYARVYSILVCNPKERASIDKYVVGVLADRYKTYSEASWGKESAQLLLEVVAYLCHEYKLMENEFICKEQGLMEFLKNAMKAEPRKIGLCNKKLVRKK